MTLLLMKMMAGNNFKLNIWKEARADIEALDGSQLIFIKKGLKRIQEYGMTCGQPLHGKLEGYRKLKNRKMGLRIVFGQDPLSGKLNIIDIVAAEKREDLEVYRNAKIRIGKKSNNQ